MSEVADQVLVARASGGVAVVTLSRPERLNALTWPMIDDLDGRLAEIGSDHDVRVVVLTGAGRGFCAGLDIGGDDIGGGGPATLAFDRQERVAGLALRLRAIPQPVIAAVNGPAAGGGMALALACDVRLFSPEARMNAAFVRLGLSGCDVGVSYLLPRIVGLGIASELLLTGRMVEADEALRIGLANRVVASEDLLEEALATAALIARNSPFGVQMTKRVLDRNAAAGGLEPAIDLENRTQILAMATADHAEALAAFNDRRDARFWRR